MNRESLVRKTAFLAWGVLLSCLCVSAQEGLWGAEASRGGAIAEVSGLASRQYSAQGLEPLDIQPGSASAKPSADAEVGVVYSEDFESVYGMNPYPLPDGWASLSTPGHEEDKWLAGTLGSGGNPVFGNSGMRYAYILTHTETPHDAWAFTPAMGLEKGETYSISFWVRLHGEVGAHYESLEVMMGTDTVAEAMNTLLYEVDDTICSWWQNVTVRYKAEESGAHYIGFHSLSPASELLYATFIDDIEVTHLSNQPQFEGLVNLDMGEVFSNVDLPVSLAYTIANRGIADLEVSLASASDGITVEGLPLTIPSDSSRDIRVSLALESNGAYDGHFVLSTNDTAHESVEVSVTLTALPCRQAAGLGVAIPSGRTLGGSGLTALRPISCRWGPRPWWNSNTRLWTGVTRLWQTAWLSSKSWYLTIMGFPTIRYMLQGRMRITGTWLRPIMPLCTWICLLMPWNHAKSRC